MFEATETAWSPFRLSLLLWTSLLVSSTTMARPERLPLSSACEAPLVLPVENTTMSREEVTRWGPAIGVGTPEQILQPALSLDFDQTSVRYPDDSNCANDGNNTLKFCEWIMGGRFDMNKSSSWDSEPQNDLVAIEYGYPDGEWVVGAWGQDKLVLGNATLDDFPLYTGHKRITPQTHLGLGRNSTLLNRLQKQGSIASRVWSLWWGWRGGQEEYQKKGSLIFGGYDKAKTSKTNYTERFWNAQECSSSLMVQLDKVAVNRADGTSVSLPGSDPMRACIKPDEDLITMPKKVWRAFNFSLPARGAGIADASPYRGAGSRDGPHKRGGMLFADKRFLGNLTFTLSTGLEITIPNHQLYVPNIVVNDEGEEVIKDEDQRLLVQDGGIDGMPVLGQPFLSSAYLYVDHDFETFTLWELNRDFTDKQDIVPVNNHPQSACKLNGTTATTEMGELTTGYDASGGDGGLSGGTIAGIVVGVVVGIVALVALIAFILLRRRRRQKAGGGATPSFRDEKKSSSSGVFGVKSKNSNPLELSAAHPEAVLPEMSPADQSMAHELPANGPRTSPEPR